MIDRSIQEWLARLGLEKYAQVFAEHEITLADLLFLTEADVDQLQLPTGPRRRVMVALQAGDVITVPISEAIANVKTVPAGGQLVRTARDTGISFGAPDEFKYHRPH